MQLAVRGRCVVEAVFAAAALGEGVGVCDFEVGHAGARPRDGRPVGVHVHVHNAEAVHVVVV